MARPVGSFREPFENKDNSAPSSASKVTSLSTILENHGETLQKLSRPPQSQPCSLLGRVGKGLLKGVFEFACTVIFGDAGGLALEITLSGLPSTSCYFESTPSRFSEWKRKQSDMIIKEVMDFFKNNSDNSDLLDPSSLGVMEHPVKPKQGGPTFDANNDNMKYVQQNKKSPVCQSSLEESDLRPDYAMMGKILKACLSELLHHKHGLSEEAQQGVSILGDQMAKYMKFCYQQEKIELDNSLKKGFIDKATYNRELLQINTLLSELNPS